MTNRPRPVGLCVAGVVGTSPPLRRCRRNVWDDDRVVSVSYSEPAVLWRLRDAAGNQARATIIPGTPQSTLVIFVNDQFERGENFEDWSEALTRADEVRSSLMESGWSPE